MTYGCFEVRRGKLDQDLVEIEHAQHCISYEEAWKLAHVWKESFDEVDLVEHLGGFNSIKFQYRNGRLV